MHVLVSVIANIHPGEAHAEEAMEVDTTLPLASSGKKRKTRELNDLLQYTAEVGTTEAENLSKALCQ